MAHLGWSGRSETSASVLNARRRIATLHRVFRSSRASAAPLTANPVRTVIEAIAPPAALLIAARAASVTPSDTPGLLLTFLAALWLIAWPAWRLYPAPPRATRPPLRHVVAAVSVNALCAVGVGLGALLLAGMLWDPAYWTTGEVRAKAGSLVEQCALCWSFIRALVLLGARLRRLCRHRLRWRLTAAHLAVILLTFLAMTGLGSLFGVFFLLDSAQSNPRAMAQAAVFGLQLEQRRSTQRTSNQEVLRAIIDGYIRLPGEATLRLPGIGVAPLRLQIVNRDGHVVAAVMTPEFGRYLGLDGAATELPLSIRRQLIGPALAGRTPRASRPVLARVFGARVISSSTELAAAPLRDGARPPNQVVVVEVPNVPHTPNGVLPLVLALFGVSSLVLLISTLGPVLLFSNLFGYLLARGLTQRLEAVSRVSTAIAAGDLTQRAPPSTLDEVGRLADNVNLMAAHLEGLIVDLQRARTQAEEALRARQELIASVSHELRTPLAIVQAHLDSLTMEGRPSSELPTPTLHALQQEAQRLSALVDDLFTLSRTDTGALRIQRMPVDIEALLRDIAALMRPWAEREGLIELSLDIEPHLPRALTDGDRLRQIVLNLLRNALRHTPDGGIVVLSARCRLPWIVLSVADTGEGIPPEHLPLIFEPFYRVDPARSHSAGGAGLGLSIVREFVELLDGTISVESTPGEGSCFQVSIPAAGAATGAIS